MSFYLFFLICSSIYFFFLSNNIISDALNVVIKIKKRCMFLFSYTIIFYLEKLSDFMMSDMIHISHQKVYIFFISHLWKTKCVNVRHFYVRKTEKILFWRLNAKTILFTAIKIYLTHAHNVILKLKKKKLKNIYI